MSKYIDADRLKAKLDEHYRKYQSKYIRTPYAQGLIDALDLAEQVIDSLQQEQDLIIINKKDWEAQEQFRKNKDFGKPLQQEQPEVDFEKEYTEFVVSDPVYSKLVNIIVGKSIARHFYELGLKVRKEK